MHYELNFDGKPEIGSFICLTNNYAIIGKSKTGLVLNFLKEKINIPIVETTIGGINTVGTLCAGNKNGLVVSNICTDQELQHIRDSIPENIRVVRVSDKLNALGNNILCNDYIALVNPEFLNDELIANVLQVPVYKHPLGSIGLVGSYALINSKGMIVHTDVTTDEISELSTLTKTNVIASTVNEGQRTISSGMVANDFLYIAGLNSTNIELKVAETVLNLSDNNISFDKREVMEEIAP